MRRGPLPQMHDDRVQAVFVGHCAPWGKGIGVQPPPSWWVRSGAQRGVEAETCGGGQRGVEAETCGVGGSGASRLRPEEWGAAGHLCTVGRRGVRTVSQSGVAPSPRRPWSRRGGEVFRPLRVFQNVPPRRGAGRQVCSMRGMHRISFRSPLCSGLGSVGAKEALAWGQPLVCSFP